MSLSQIEALAQYKIGSNDWRLIAVTGVEIPARQAGCEYSIAQMQDAKGEQRSVQIGREELNAWLKDPEYSKSVYDSLRVNGRLPPIPIRQVTWEPR